MALPVHVLHHINARFSDAVSGMALVGSQACPVGVAHRTVAVLVWLLSKSETWAASYLLSVSRGDPSRVSAFSDATSLALHLLSWLGESAIALAVDRACDDFNDGFRIRADDFLMRSLVAEFVSAQNIKGIAVPTAVVIETYLRLWLHRPCPPRLQDGLVKLTYHFNTRRKFGVNFRSEWMLQHSTIQAGRVYDHGEIAERVTSV